MEGDLRKGHGNAPCKACTAFKTWAKTQKQQGKDAQKEDHLGAECPLDKDELGRSTWNFLHTMAAYYPEKPTSEEQTKMKELIKNFSVFYPCDVCAKHLRDDIKKTPPDVSSSQALAQWFCQVHNRVNVRLGKSVFDCTRVKERWKDGWLDGSCD